MNKRIGTKCRIPKCPERSYDIGGICPTHTNMAAAIRAAQRGQLSQAGREYFLDALERGYGV